MFVNINGPCENCGSLLQSSCAQQKNRFSNSLVNHVDIVWAPTDTAVAYLLDLVTNC